MNVDKTLPWILSFQLHFFYKGALTPSPNMGDYLLQCCVNEEKVINTFSSIHAPKDDSS